ncbi:BspA family leucine-rich repeat surface protein [Dyadobacter sp. OTU695]|uniref:BspA family leucine-rich repeat surface protein n=1 Tax=Dyadobacter sp. OTU695 TaxID=3043860 RepID=UPI00313BAC78
MNKLFTFLLLICALHANAQYITVWKSDNQGTSANNQIIIPAKGNGYSIAWEEIGNPANNGTAIGTNNYTLTFPTPGTYQVSITPGSGTFTRISFASRVDYYKLLEIRQWGDIQWESMEDAYLGCYNLKVTATDAPDLHNVTSMKSMFSTCQGLQTVPGINNWDVSSVKDMTFLFSATTAFDAPLDQWDVSNVTDMTGMFRNSAFDHPIGNWNVGNVTNMYLMFGDAFNFNQPIGSWDVSKVTRMSGMFGGATNFNQPLNDWDVSRVIYMDGMFFNAQAFNQPVDNWNVSKAQSMASMFSKAAAFNQPVGSWDVSNVLYMQGMFRDATTFNQPLSTWDVSKVTDMPSMFENAAAFNQPIGNWRVDGVLDMSSMFLGAVAFNQPIGNWNVGQVINMKAMFQQTAAFNQPIDSWDVSQVTDMSYMFFYASAFNQPVNNWDLSKATNIFAMFYGAASFNQPVDKWNVSGVTNMFGAFAGATAFNQSLGAWTLAPGADMTYLLAGSGLDCVNMTLTLQGWAENTAMPSNITFGAQGITYGSPGTAALQTLRTAKNWTIDIGGEVICEALAVTLISFNAKSANGIVKLDWATASETDNDYFDAERSADARNWQAIGRVKGAGTVNIVHNYTIIDASPLEGRSFYRLKIVDFQGKAEYSHIRAIQINNSPAPTVYPNPTTTSLTLSGKTTGQVRIYSLSGQELKKIEVKGEKTLIPIKELPVGGYLLKSDDGWSTKFIKQGSTY